MTEQNNELIQRSTEYRSVNADARYGTHWHVRISGIKEDYIEEVNAKIKEQIDKENFSYARGGLESGEDGSTHYHIAIGYRKSVTKWVLFKVLGLKAGNTEEANCKQWYIAPIYKESTPEANAKYATKSNVTIDYGNVPKESQAKEASEAKATAAGTKWREMIEMAKLQKWDELETKFPYQYINQGAKLRALYFVQKTPTDRHHLQHYWIQGAPGTGKSAVVEYLFPNHFKKRADEDWLGYNPALQPGHRTVYLPDFDMNTMAKIKPETLKVMCDPQGFNANKKFAGGDMIAPGQIVISSNFTIDDCVPLGIPQRSTQIEALKRRFQEISIDKFLQQRGLKLKNKTELNQLKTEGNFDYSKCFDKIETTHLETTPEEEEPNEDIIRKDNIENRTPKRSRRYL